MGYTHYWDFKKKPTEIENGKQKFSTAVELIKEGLKYLDDIELADGMGKNEPVFSETEVWFNGKGPDAYESFYISVDDPEVCTDNFCKTQYRPYDVVVCLSLLCFKEAFKDDFSFSSDGDMDKEDGWIRAKTIFNKIKDD